MKQRIMPWSRDLNMVDVKLKNSCLKGVSAIKKQHLRVFFSKFLYQRGEVKQSFDFIAVNHA